MSKKDSIELKGKKTILKPITMFDIMQMTTWEQYSDILLYDYNFPNWTYDEMQEWYKAKTKGKRLCFAVYESKEELIGFLSFRKVHPLIGTGEIGIVIKNSYMDMGYGADIIYTFANWLFNERKFKSITLLVALYNIRALKCYNKVGFKVVKHFTDICYNSKIDPFNDSSLNNIKKYFKQTGNKIYTEYYKMKLTPTTLKYSR